MQRYHRIRHEYDHYDRRQQMLHSITIQKQDELEHLITYINQLVVVIENQTSIISRRTNNTMEKELSLCIFDHGDHMSMPPMMSLENYTIDENEESNDDDDDDDPLLQRLKLTKPSRLQSSSRQIIPNSNRKSTLCD